MYVENLLDTVDNHKSKCGGTFTNTYMEKLMVTNEESAAQN